MTKLHNGPYVLHVVSTRVLRLMAQVWHSGNTPVLDVDTDDFEALGVDIRLSDVDLTLTPDGRLTAAVLHRN